MKQKQAVLWKYFPTVSGVTLYSATPVTGVLRQIARGVEGKLLLAERQADFLLHRVEIPGQVGVRVGIEADSDELARRAGSDRGADLRCAGIAGDGAEHAIQRNGGERDADHGDRDRGKRDAECAVVHPHDVTLAVMAGLDPAICRGSLPLVMAGTSPAMTGKIACYDFVILTMVMA